MKAVVILVAIFQFLRGRVKKFHIVCGAKFGRSCGTALQVTKGGLYKAGLSSLGTMEHFQNQMRVSLKKNDYASFSKCWGEAMLITYACRVERKGRK